MSIEGLTFKTIIGILEHERTSAQKVTVSTEITYSKHDDSFINYAEVTSLIKEQMQEEKYLLVEDALEGLCSGIKEKYLEIESIKLKILKPDILDDCVVGVEVFKIY